MNSSIIVPEKPFEILGKITWTLYSRGKEGEKFKVLDTRSGIPRDFMVTCHWKCPVEKGDIFYGLCEAVPQKKEKNLDPTLQVKVIKPPFVRAGTDQDTIVAFFCKHVRGWSRARATELYTSLVRITGGEDQVDEYLSKLSEQWVHEADDTLLTQFSDLLNPKSMSALLNNWYTSFDRRRSKLLGLSDEEINACESSSWSCHDIYHLCLTNPFKLYPVDYTKCLTLLKRMKRSATPEDLECGKIVRRIYQNTMSRGWTCTPAKFLANEFSQLSTVGEHLKKFYPIQVDMGCVYLQHHYNVETRIVKYLSHLIMTDKESVDEFPMMLEGDTFLSPDQQRAVQGALNHKFSIITGGAGTGKTTAIRAIVRNLEKRGISYAICAFTGKAVARLREVLENPCPMTLHLKIKRHKANEFQHLIIDEASMLEMSLFLRFVDCFRLPYKITLVGDAHQLPPIGWGSLFSQCISSGVVPTYRLTQNHRVYKVKGEQDGITLNAQKIIHNVGTAPVRFYPTSNFTILQGGMDHVIAIGKAFQKQGVTPYEFTVITPYNKDLKVINKTFQELYHGSTEALLGSQGRKWYVGDRVMMVENDYEINVMNGEEGRVIQHLKDKIKVSFGPGREYDFPLAPAVVKSGKKSSFRERSVKQLVHSYAVTTHKGQGSEWNYILMYLPISDRSESGGNKFINKNLVYTSITRAKRAFFFVGDVGELQSSTARSLPFRSENLTARLKHICPQWETQKEGEDYDEPHEDYEESFEDYEDY